MFPFGITHWKGGINGDMTLDELFLSYVCDENNETHGKSGVMAVRACTTDNSILSEHGS